MLKAPAEYPAAGSVAYLAPTGEQVRIQRRNDDGTFLISRNEVQPGIASGNITVGAIQLHRTCAQAINAKGRTPRARRSA